MTPMRIAIGYDDIFLAHGEEGHIENRRRLEAILRRLDHTGWLRRAYTVFSHTASPQQIAWLHDPGYVEEVRLVSEQGGGYLDLDTVATADTFKAALVAAGTCMRAARDVMAAETDAAFCLVRPPGHHATRSRGMGFCFFNNVALAAEAAIRDGARRVAIIDWDVHHGNGTQEMFYHRGDVLYFSIHQAYYAGARGIFYPGTGTVDEVGVDAGLGKTLNVPLPAGADDQDYIEVFDQLVLPALRAYKPELVLVSAGFDAHHSDPLGGMLLTVPAFHRMTAMLCRAADELCDGRIVLVLEGGYDFDACAFGVEDCLRALIGEPSAHGDDAAPAPRPEDHKVVRRYLEHAISLHKQRSGI